MMMFEGQSCITQDPLSPCVIWIFGVYEDEVWCGGFGTIVASCQVFSCISLKSPFSICSSHRGPLGVRLIGSREMDEGGVGIGTSGPTIVASGQEVAVTSFYSHFFPHTNELPLRLWSNPIFNTNCAWIGPSTLSAKSHIASVLCLKSSSIESWQVRVDNIPLGPSIVGIRLMHECEIRSRASSNTIIASGQVLSIIGLEGILTILVDNWSPERPSLMIWLMDKSSIRISRCFPAVVASCKIISVASLKGYLIANDLKGPGLIFIRKDLDRSKRGRVRIGTFSTGMAYFQELAIISCQIDSSSREIHSGIVTIVEMDGLNQEGCSQQECKFFFEHN